MRTCYVKCIRLGPLYDEVSLNFTKVGVMGLPVDLIAP